MATHFAVPRACAPVAAIPRAVALVLLVLLHAGAARAAGPLAAETEMALGAADAPVTIVEYASMTCPHCARFHTDDLPGIREAYIDTGKVRLVFSEFPLDRLALAAAKVARCGGEERFFAFIGLMFDGQREWAGAEDPIAALRRLAKVGGLGAAEFDACLVDEALEQGILKKSLEATETHEIKSTPSFVINGELLVGQLTAAKLGEIIARQEPSATRASEPDSFWQQVVTFFENL